MTSCLLSWHGSIVAQRGFSLSLAFLSDVIAGMAAPVSLSGNGGLVEIQPIDPSGGRPLYAVRAGNVFLTAAPGHGCGTASQIQG
ncbi:MAG: hypothetical protein ABF917_11250 [Gluconobacter oxydans]|uniref:hypothetical protein n=1 Tax=Gluconobacter oxydans TaxID=442 RepID=UPI0039EAB13E